MFEKFTNILEAKVNEKKAGKPGRKPKNLQIDEKKSKLEVISESSETDEVNTSEEEERKARKKKKTRRYKCIDDKCHQKEEYDGRFQNIERNQSIEIGKNMVLESEIKELKAQMVELKS